MGKTGETKGTVQTKKPKKPDKIDKASNTGKPAAGLKMSRKGKATLVLTGCVLVTLLVMLVCLGYGYYHSRIALLDFDDGTVSQAGSIADDDSDVLADNEAMQEATQDLEEMQAIAAEGDVFGDKDVFNVLLIGTDDPGKEFSTNARGDSCMLASINKKTMVVHLVSFERGMGVPILDGQYKGQWDWLTHTFRYGGADLMMREIEECFKIEVDYYLRANIYTFMQMIDAVGGVDIELTQAEADYINHPEGTYGINHIRQMGVQDSIQTVSVGINHLNGPTAMLYSRCRYIDSDWKRIGRQRNVIEAIIRQSKGLGILELNDLLNTVLPLLKTNLTEGEITSLLLALAPNAAKVTVEQMTVPAQGTYGSMTGMGGRSLFAVDFDTNAKLLQETLYGSQES